MSLGHRFSSHLASLALAPGPVSVDYTTVDTGAAGVATANVDYLPTAGTLTFAPGETTKTITVDVLGDTIDEPDETFFVDLSNPANARFVDSSGYVDRITCPLPFDVQAPNSCANTMYHVRPVFCCSSAL